MTTADSHTPAPGESSFGPVPGALVAGRYRLVRPLGEGGMGAVFEAENVLTFKRAAVKWVHPRLSSNEVASARLLHEARATSRIRHRHVVDVYDVVLDGTSVMLVMELLQGKLLSEHLEQTSMQMFELVRLLLPAMEGVAAAHAVGVVHRDIKPENIFLVDELDHWLPKVIDFGIAKTFGSELARITHSGMVVGTPRYISFEQLRGDADVDGRTDVYAFGVMLYEALLGRPPYDAKTLGDQAVQFLTTLPPSPRAQRPEVPEPLDALVRRAIACDRGERFASMRELVDTLRPFAEPSAFPRTLAVRRVDAAPPDGAYAANADTCPYSSTTPTPLRPSDNRLVEKARKRRASWLLVCVAFALVLGLLLASGQPAPARPQARVTTQEPVAATPVQPAPIASTQPEAPPPPPSAPSAPPPSKPRPIKRAAAQPAAKLVASPEPVLPAAADTPTREDAHLRAGHVRHDEF